MKRIALASRFTKMNRTSRSLSLSLIPVCICQWTWSRSTRSRGKAANMWGIHGTSSPQLPLEVMWTRALQKRMTTRKITLNRFRVTLILVQLFYYVHSSHRQMKLKFRDLNFSQICLQSGVRDLDINRNISLHSFYRYKLLLSICPEEFGRF